MHTVCRIYQIRLIIETSVVLSQPERSVALGLYFNKQCSLGGEGEVDGEELSWGKIWQDKELESWNNWDPK